jgi:Fic family protein
VLPRPCDPKRLIAEVHRVLARSRALSLEAKLAIDHAQVAYAKATVDRVARDHMRRRRERANALRRLRLDYLKLPGLRMTVEESARFWDLEPRACERLLESLVQERFLTRTSDGRYKRP